MSKRSKLDVLIDKLESDKRRIEETLALLRSTDETTEQIVRRVARNLGRAKKTGEVPA